jgi:mevalonate kinase
VDFLHSRLTPVPTPKVPRWVIYSSIAAVVLLAVIISAYGYSQSKQTQLDSINADINSVTRVAQVKAAKEFVDKVTFAQAWHMGDPRYLACLRDLTSVLPRDGQTYATSLNLKEDLPPPSAGYGGSSGSSKVAVVRSLTGRLEGKTTSQGNALQAVEQLKTLPGSFQNVKSGGTSVANRGEVSFSVTFTYLPPKTAP